MKQELMTKFENEISKYKSLQKSKNQIMTRFSFHLTDKFNKVEDLSKTVCNPNALMMQMLAPLLQKLAPIFSAINALSLKMHCIQDATNSPNIMPITDFGNNSSMSSIFSPKEFSLNYTTDDDYPYSQGQVDRALNFEKRNIKKGTEEKRHQSGNYTKRNKRGDTLTLIKGNTHNTFEKTKNTHIKENDISLVEKIISYYGKEKVHIGSDKEIHMEVGGVGIKIIEGKVYIQEECFILGDAHISGSLDVGGSADIRSSLSVGGTITDVRGDLTNFKTTDKSSRA